MPGTVICASQMLLCTLTCMNLLTVSSGRSSTEPIHGWIAALAMTMSTRPQVASVGVDEVLQLVLAADVAGHGDGLAARRLNLGQGLRAAVRLASGDDDLRAVLGSCASRSRSRCRGSSR